jgi:hypothetical protein
LIFLTLPLSPALAWFSLDETNQYFFLRTVYFQASVGAIPSVDYFVNPKIPFSKYLEFLLPILEPSLNVLRRWTFLLSPQSEYSPNSGDYNLEDFMNMGLKESDVTQEMDTFFPGLWRTKTTRVDEPQLREKYSIPTSVRLRFGSENEGAMVRSDEHEICV